MNPEDLEAKRIFQQARPPAMGTPFNSASVGNDDITSNAITSSTLQNDAGEPKRLWIPGFDPWGVDGFYFGNAPLPEIQL